MLRQIVIKHKRTLKCEEINLILPQLRTELNLSSLHNRLQNKLISEKGDVRCGHVKEISQRQQLKMGALCHDERNR